NVVQPVLAVAYLAEVSSRLVTSFRRESPSGQSSLHAPRGLAVKLVCLPSRIFGKGLPTRRGETPSKNAEKEGQILGSGPCSLPITLVNSPTGHLRGPGPISVHTIRSGRSKSKAFSNWSGPPQPTLRGAHFRQSVPFACWPQAAGLSPFHSI